MRGPTDDLLDRRLLLDYALPLFSTGSFGQLVDAADHTVDEKHVVPAGLERLRAERRPQSDDDQVVRRDDVDALLLWLRLGWGMWMVSLCFILTALAMFRSMARAEVREAATTQQPPAGPVA